MAERNPQTTMSPSKPPAERPHLTLVPNPPDLRPKSIGKEAHYESSQGDLQISHELDSLDEFTDWLVQDGLEPEANDRFKEFIIGNRWYVKGNVREGARGKLTGSDVRFDVYDIDECIRTGERKSSSLRKIELLPLVSEASDKDGSVRIEIAGKLVELSEEERQAHQFVAKDPFEAIDNRLSSLPEATDRLPEQDDGLPPPPLPDINPDEGKDSVLTESEARVLSDMRKAVEAAEKAEQAARRRRKQPRFKRIWNKIWSKSVDSYENRHQANMHARQEVRQRLTRTALTAYDHAPEWPRSQALARAAAFLALLVPAGAIGYVVTEHSDSQRPSVKKEATGFGRQDNDFFGQNVPAAAQQAVDALRKADAS